MSLIRSSHQPLNPAEHNRLEHTSGEGNRSPHSIPSSISLSQSPRTSSTSSSSSGSSDDEMLEEWEEEEDLLRGSKVVSSVGAGTFWFRLEHNHRNPTVGRKFAKFPVVLRNLTMRLKFTLGVNGDTLLFQYYRAHKEQQMMPQRPLYEGFATFHSSCIRDGTIGFAFKEHPKSQPDAGTTINLTNLNKYFGKGRFFKVDLLFLNPPPVDEISEDHGHRKKRKDLRQIFKNLRSIGGQDTPNESGVSGDDELDDEADDHEVSDVSNDQKDGEGRPGPSTGRTTTPGRNQFPKQGLPTKTKRRAPSSKTAIQRSSSASKKRQVAPKRPASGRKTSTQPSARVTNNLPASSSSKASPTGEQRLTRSQTRALFQDQARLDSQTQTREARRLVAVEVPPYRMISGGA